MSKTIVVEVTQDDIDKGKFRTSSECPIALSLKRLFPHFIPGVGIKGNMFLLNGLPSNARMDNGTLRFDTSKFPNLEERQVEYAKYIEWRGNMPAEAIAFQTSFDKKEPVQPFSFSVNLYR